MKIKRITSSIICINLLLISTLASAESVNEYCHNDTSLPPFLFFIMPLAFFPDYAQTCVSIKNTGEKDLKVVFEDYPSINPADGNLVHPKYIIIAQSHAQAHPSVKVTVTNINSDNKILFNDDIKNYTGLECNETQCTAWT